MLTVTDSAVNEIRTLTDQPEAPEGAGVRITSDPSAGSLILSLAATPDEDDTVVDTGGARVFLDSGASAMLEDKSLIATTDPAGQVQFAVAEQPS
jgi:iron-sulfur cluster assembly protein